MGYMVEYSKNGEAYAYDTYKPGTLISAIVDELNYEMNRYGVDYDEITIFESDDEESATIYYKVVNIHGNYKLVEIA